MEKIFIACDHAAFKAKEELKTSLASLYEVIDLGTHSEDSVHYPEYATNLCQEVLKNKGKGILLCGSGIGVSMVANRYKGIRAALCRDVDDAKMTRLHNDANVLCLAGRKTEISIMIDMATVFLTTEFEGGRHQKRLDLFKDLGQS